MILVRYGIEMFMRFFLLEAVASFPTSPSLHDPEKQKSKR